LPKPSSTSPGSVGHASVAEADHGRESGTADGGWASIRIGLVSAGTAFEPKYCQGAVLEETRLAFRRWRERWMFGDRRPDDVPSGYAVS
jgi:hypothetical protein